jgi:hypothetical protein
VRAVWSAPGNNTIQGNSNVLIARMMNTLKRELYKQQSQLLVDHQQEDLVDGGDAATIQFHYLLAPDVSAMASNTAVTYVFDANAGVAGPTGPTGPVNTSQTSDYVFETRRDFDYNARGF